MTPTLIILSLIDALQTWPHRSKEANRFARWFLDRGLVVYAGYKVGITAGIVAFHLAWWAWCPVDGYQAAMGGVLVGYFFQTTTRNWKVIFGR